MIFTARTPEAIAATASARGGSGVLEGHAVDLGSLASIRAFAAGLSAAGTRVDVLFNCAGVLQQSPTRRTTSDGFEETLGVNTLAPYLLTHELWPALARPGARVVNVSSRLHLPDSRGVPVRFDFEDPQLERGYQPDRAYKNSKLALMWVTHELARRAAGAGVTVNAVCPGFVPVTAAQSTHGAMRFFMKHVLRFMPFAASVEQAVDSFVFMALDASLDATSGGFFGEKQRLEPSPESRDLEKCARFWALAARLTGVDPAWPG